MRTIATIAICACLLGAPACSFNVPLDPNDPTVAAILEASGGDNAELERLLEAEWNVGIARIQESLDGTKTAIIEDVVTDVGSVVAEKIGTNDPIQTGGIAGLVALILGGGAVGANRLRSRYELKKKTSSSK